MSQLSVRLPDDFIARLEARGEKSTAIRESLDRYFSLMARAQVGLRDRFSEAELSLMADAANGTLHESWSIPLLAHEIEDALALDNLGKKWSVDGPALLAKLHALDLTSTFALVDALERFWVGVSKGQDIPHADILK